MNHITLGYTPALGWNSWNTFTWDISEKLIMETADALVANGYLEAGYEYLVIDDCWSLKERDEQGNLIDGKYICSTVAYAPADNPQIAICIAAEGAGSGSSLAPIAAKVYDYYFNEMGTFDEPQCEGELLG